VALFSSFRSFFLPFFLSSFLPSFYKQHQMFVYIVIENGTPYPNAFTSYEKAAEAVRANYKAEIDEDTYYKENGMQIVNELFTEESPTGMSRMYVEKGIHIEIHRLPVS